MLHQKTDSSAVPVAVSIFRVVHGLLILHAIAIVGITFFMNNDIASAIPFGMTPEHIFATVVAIPLGIGSFAFLLATTIRALFTLGIFFCSFLAFVLSCLPMMTPVFFPMHLAALGFAAIYGLSCLVLIHFFFVQPMPKKK